MKGLGIKDHPQSPWESSYEGSWTCRGIPTPPVSWFMDVPWTLPFAALICSNPINKTVTFQINGPSSQVVYFNSCVTSFSD